nr:immunoglobulin light chain junction region [Macaca mulatta]
DYFCQVWDDTSEWVF